MIEVEKQAVDIDAFPSVRATTYAVWHKFYADRDRRWTRSDAFDIIIASAIPYVDAVVTESHQAEALRKTKRIDDFLRNVTVHMLRDFRHSAPAATSPPLDATSRRRPSIRRAPRGTRIGRIRLPDANDRLSQA